MDCITGFMEQKSFLIDKERRKNNGQIMSVASKATAQSPVYNR
jgi:hypothetical protein